MKILLIDILAHPKFSMIPDYIEVINKVNSKIVVDISSPLDNENKFPNELSQYNGIIITGSIIKWNSNHEMIINLKSFIKFIHQEYSNIPVLAVCMTHELIANMFGAEIQLNKHGSEIGTINIQLTKQGIQSNLFKNFPKNFKIQSAHSHDVMSKPKNSITLAKNDRNQFQAFQIDNFYCIQFHADLSAKSLINWISTYSSPEELISSGVISNTEEYQNLIDSIHETPQRIQLFINFLKICEKNLFFRK